MSFKCLSCGWFKVKNNLQCVHVVSAEIEEHGVVISCRTALNGQICVTEYIEHSWKAAGNLEELPKVTY